jgi:hypothetical protein
MAQMVADKLLYNKAGTQVSLSHQSEKAGGECAPRDSGKRKW